MKKTVRVTVIKEIELDIPDDRFTEQSLTDFGSYIGWSEDDLTTGSMINEIFECAARQVFDGSDNYADGVGQAGSKWMKKRYPDKVEIVVDELYEEWEAEVVE